MIIHGDFGLLWEKIMKRGLFLLLAMFSINPIFSFGRIPSMRMIKKDIEANSMLYVINYYCPFGLPPLINKMVGEPFLLYHWRFFAQR